LQEGKEYPIQGDGRLTEYGSKELLSAVQTLSLAKNIQLMKGTVGVWERLAVHDMVKGVFNFKEFLEGINTAIRMPMYNRVDYADIYAEAKALGEQRKQAEGYKLQQERQKDRARRIQDDSGQFNVAELKKEFLKHKKGGDNIEKS